MAARGVQAVPELAELRDGTFDRVDATGGAPRIGNAFGDRFVPFDALRSARTPVISSVMRDAQRGMWIDGDQPRDSLASSAWNVLRSMSTSDRAPSAWYAMPA